jgi:hypothetical protein
MNLSLALSLLAATGAAPEVVGLSPQAQAEYDQKYLSVADELEVRHGNSSMTHQVYQGKYRKPITEEDFYRLVGVPQHAEFIQRRRLWQTGLLIGGLAAMAVGTAISVSALSGGCDRDVSDPLFGECVRADVARDRNPASGTVFFLGGAGLALSAVFLNGHAAPPEEMRRLADEYNRALRTRLTAGRPTGPKDHPAFQLQALPYAAPGGLGMVLRGAF